MVQQDVAGRNWTGLDTPEGKPLMVLAAVWLAGRLAMAFGSGVWVAIIDLAFLPVAAGMLLRVLIKAKSKRNYFVGALPAMLALANLFFHLAVLGVIDADPLTAMHLALGLVVLLETIVGGCRHLSQQDIQAGPRQQSHCCCRHPSGRAGAGCNRFAIRCVLLVCGHTRSCNIWHRH